MGTNSAKDEIEIDSMSNPLLSNDAEIPEKVGSSMTINAKKGNIYLKHWRDFLSVIFACDTKEDREAWKGFGMFGMIVISVAWIICFLIFAPFYLIRHLVITGVLDCYDIHVKGPVATSECTPDGNGGNLYDTTTVYVFYMWIYVALIGVFILCCFVCIDSAHERIQKKKESLLEKQI
jgi:hypothetical protein